ncbi:ATP-dependent DNA helicase UvrD2 [Cutibacterium sp. WCA-380-WT-3A]|uniref:DNA 3'-5' helicase n=1 Tax=Cutibacterium porci TaxID=2605781 RepID=A0A7K0J614_9ACTN|nr:ATP-dependent DNA helicase UvrD2 [Cutibacterium porci]MSS45379.1 ATP-dependent DNA helicase UvrD2 [Cutibacterium porci]
MLLSAMPLMVIAVRTQSADAILAALDPEQAKVAKTFDVPVCVIAGAGTGKTRAVTHRIAYGAATGKLDPRRTLAVTFTTKAAGTMRGRLADLGVVGVQARTIHSAALRQIKFFWPRAYNCELPPVSDSRFSMVAEASRRVGLGSDKALLRDLSAEISWAKVSNVTNDQYASLARAEGRVVAGVSATDVGRVLAGYEAVKRECCVIDLDDILLCAVGLLVQHRDITEEIRNRYQHFVVDEYQDISPLQHRLLELWFGDRNDVCVVGDPHQAIHSYAGARSDYLLNFVADHPGAKRIDLVRNYRSTPEVIRLANEVLVNRVTPEEALEHGTGVTLVSRGRSGPEPIFQALSDEASEAAAVAMWIESRHAAGIPWSEVAVLYRINSQAAHLETALAERSIPYLVRGSERFYDRGEVRCSLDALAQLVADEPGADPLPAFDQLLVAHGWSTTAPEGEGDIRQRWESLQALHDLAVSHVNDGVTTLEGLAAVFSRRAATQEPPVGDAVTLATLHASKGLEWDVVALYGISDAMVPFVMAETPAEMASERRLLHVGVTRARRDLWVSYSWAGGNRERQGISRFLRGLPGTGDMTDRSPQHPRSRRATIMVCSVCGRPLTAAKDRKLGHHLGCTVGVDPDLVDRLRQWRSERAEADRVPAFVILTDATLLSVAERRPHSVESLLQVPGIGRRKADLYAADLITVLHDFSSDNQQ